MTLPPARSDSHQWDNYGNASACVRLTLSNVRLDAARQALNGADLIACEVLSLDRPEIVGPDGRRVGVLVNATPIRADDARCDRDRFGALLDLVVPRPKRQHHFEPVCDQRQLGRGQRCGGGAFFAWRRERCARPDLLPRSPLAKAGAPVALVAEPAGARFLEHRTYFPAG